MGTRSLLNPGSCYEVFYKPCSPQNNLPVALGVLLRAARTEVFIYNPKREFHVEILVTPEKRASLTLLLGFGQ